MTMTDDEIDRIAAFRQKAVPEGVRLITITYKI